MKLISGQCLNVADDTVYLDGEEGRQEYVMNDVGLIWRGTYNRLRPTVWKYSQFEKDILDCALYMMNDVGKTRATSRNDPIVICRILSAAVRKSFFKLNFSFPYSIINSICNLIFNSIF